MTEQELYTLRCLELAQRGKGRVTPNPLVGALLVYEGRIIGEGWHRQYGQAHAEVNAFEDVQAEDRHLIPDCTMYVSLEPCAHYGHTPPCAERIVREGIRHVVVCNDDPFPKVSGRGYDILAQSGVTIDRGTLNAHGRWVNRRFFCAQEQNRPYVILKWAQTQNGFFAPLNRTRYQMSNKVSQTLVHKWRTEEGAILAGAGTVLHDDPQLTARLWTGKQPLRVILDKNATLPFSLRVMNSDAETIVINQQKDDTQKNITHVKIDFDNGLLTGVLRELIKKGKQSLIVEGGAHTLQSFIDAGLWDEARVFITPPLLSNGLAAPLLRHSHSCFTTALDADVLNVYARSDSPYPYVAGMDL